MYICRWGGGTNWQKMIWSVPNSVTIHLKILDGLNVEQKWKVFVLMKQKFSWKYKFSPKSFLMLKGFFLIYYFLRLFLIYTISSGFFWYTLFSYCVNVTNMQNNKMRMKKILTQLLLGYHQVSSYCDGKLIKFLHKFIIKLSKCINCFCWVLQFCFLSVLALLTVLVNIKESRFVKELLLKSWRNLSESAQKEKF